MSTTVQTATSNNNKEELALPPEILQDDFELVQYLTDYIASFQCQCPCFKQAESAPDSHRHPPSPAADGAANKGAGQSSSPGPVLRLPGNPCRSLIVWRSERRTSLITINKQERERIKAFECHFEPVHPYTRWGGAGGRGKFREPEEEVLEFDP